VDLDAKRVLVTGAGSGIGRATTIHLAELGARVVGLDRDADTLAETVAAAGYGAEALVCDLLDRAAVPVAVHEAAARLGGLDGVCNIAGVSHGFTLDEDLTLEDWDRVIGINLTGTWLVCQAALGHLKASRGAIVNTSSTAATDGTPYQSAYAASKGGVIALSRTLAVDQAAAGLRVNVIAPGPIDTPIAQQYSLPEGADPALLGLILPFGNLGRAEEVAAVYAFLVSDAASHVNGQIIKVDGGKRA
jgi:NAD(P)-dependent dehydrogenase (short-subunit alcohol dehydrogenase family)